jgi:hypothetical protein
MRATFSTHLVLLDLDIPTIGEEHSTRIFSYVSFSAILSLHSSLVQASSFQHFISVYVQGQQGLTAM